MERGPEKSEKYDFDEKSGHVKFKGSLRPDGTQRRDRMIKISTGYFSKKTSFFHYLNQNLTQNCSLICPVNYVYI